MNVFGDICGIRSNGSLELSTEEMLQLIERTQSIVSEQTKQIRRLLKENKAFLHKEKGRRLEEEKNASSALQFLY